MDQLAFSALEACPGTSAAQLNMEQQHLMQVRVAKQYRDASAVATYTMRCVLKLLMEQHLNVNSSLNFDRMTSTAAALPW